MKNYYKISEISKLYGIGVDSLRYYEKIGVLKPKRGKNNYRLYSLNDLYILNIIRDLRELNFSMKRIKEYLDNQSINNSLKLFYDEKNTVKKQIALLLEINLSLEEKISVLNRAKNYITHVFEIKHLENRSCVQLNTDISRDEEADFAIQKLNAKYEDSIFNLGKQPIGASISVSDLKDENYTHFSSIFYILGDEKSDYFLPKGKYLSYFYTGSYNKSPDFIKKTIAYADENDLTILGDVYEIYHIDNRYTVKTEEFLTEIQVRIG